jgi:hypothetical protein
MKAREDREPVDVLFRDNVKAIGRYRRIKRIGCRAHHAGERGRQTVKRVPLSDEVTAIVP